MKRLFFSVWMPSIYIIIKTCYEQIVGLFLCFLLSLIVSKLCLSYTKGYEWQEQFLPGEKDDNEWVGAWHCCHLTFNNSAESFLHLYQQIVTSVILNVQHP